MAGMVVEYDTEAGAFYVRVTDGAVARTVEVPTFANVDLEDDDGVVGLAFCLRSAVTLGERATLEERHPGPSRSATSSDSLGSPADVADTPS